MKFWTVVSLAVCALVVGGAVAAQELLPDMTAYFTPVVVLGGAGAAVALTLWTAGVIGLGRRGAPPTRSARVDDMVSDLLKHARTASTKGVLALADAKPIVRPLLFAEGVRMLVAGDPAGEIRSRLERLHAETAENAGPGPVVFVAICRVLPVVSLSTALTIVVWMLGTVAKHEPISGMTPIGLLSAIYGAFAVAALASDAADRLLSNCAEHELGAMLVAEAMFGIRSGESVEAIERRLREVLPGGPKTQVSVQPGLRRAA